MNKIKKLLMLCCTIPLFTSCDISESLNILKDKLNLNSLSVNSDSVNPDDSDNSDSPNMDGVQINEYRKKGKIARFFCDPKTGTIKLKVGTLANSVENIDSPEGFNEALEMPGNDYIHIGGGFVDMVVTIVPSEKGNQLSIQGIHFFIAGKNNTPEQLKQLNEIDFVYHPCSYLAMRTDENTINPSNDEVLIHDDDEVSSDEENSTDSLIHDDDHNQDADKKVDVFVLDKQKDSNADTEESSEDNNSSKPSEVKKSQKPKSQRKKDKSSPAKRTDPYSFAL